MQIGPRVQLLTPTHPVEAEPRRAKWESALPIVIGDNAWLGGGVIVCPGSRSAPTRWSAPGPSSPETFRRGCRSRKPGAHRARARVGMATPGQLQIAQMYNDSWRGWPVQAASHRQHPIRGSFLDPRPEPELGAVFHDGVDVAVRDDRPERGAPPGRTHRVYAMEGGPSSLRLLVASVGSRTSGTSDTGTSIRSCRPASRSPPGSTSAGRSRGLACPSERVRLHEWTADRRQSPPPRRELHPYVDERATGIREIRFYTPATPAWSGGRPRASPAFRMREAPDPRADSSAG